MPPRRFIPSSFLSSIKGFQLEVVARLLGHKTTQLTTHYVKLLEKNIIKEVGSAFGKV